MQASEKARQRTGIPRCWVASTNHLDVSQVHGQTGSKKKLSEASESARAGLIGRTVASEAMTDRAPAIDTALCPTAELPWAELLPGIELKVLRTGEGSGRYTLMNRFAPGTVLPRHLHHGEVHAWTVEGTWGYREYDWTATAGDYVYEPAGSVHTLVVPDDAGPAVVQFVIDQGLDFLDDAGDVVHREDAESITTLYLETLDSAGIARPTVLP